MDMMSILGVVNSVALMVFAEDQLVYYTFYEKIIIFLAAEQVFLLFKAYIHSLIPSGNLIAMIIHSLIPYWSIQSYYVLLTPITPSPSIHSLLPSGNLIDMIIHTHTHTPSLSSSLSYLPPSPPPPTIHSHYPLRAGLGGRHRSSSHSSFTISFISPFHDLLSLLPLLTLSHTLTLTLYPLLLPPQSRIGWATLRLLPLSLHLSPHRSLIPSPTHQYLCNLCSNTLYPLPLPLQSRIG